VEVEVDLIHQYQEMVELEEEVLVVDQQVLQMQV
tara:strand:- start:68 stop:169 length:102 start_codon:yes stop_codon:yes gene_type:complete